MGEERKKFLEKLLNKKEIGLDDLGIYQPIQIAKHAKIKGFIDRLTEKHALEQKPRLWLYNLFLISQKPQKFRVFSHTKFSLKRLRKILTNSLH